MNSRPSFILSIFLVWMFLEFLAFTLAVYVFGWLVALGLGLLTSFVGAGILRKVGVGASRQIQAALGGDPLPQGNMLDGLLTAVGGILLILPGFLSDVVGLALAAPSLRQWLARRLAKEPQRRGAGSPEVIELAPGEWSHAANPPPQDARKIARAKH